MLRNISWLNPAVRCTSCDLNKTCDLQPMKALEHRWGGGAHFMKCLWRIFWGWNSTFKALPSGDYNPGGHYSRNLTVNSYQWALPIVLAVVPSDSRISVTVLPVPSASCLVSVAACAAVSVVSRASVSPRERLSRSMFSLMWRTMPDIQNILVITDNFG